LDYVNIIAKKKKKVLKLVSYSQRSV